MDSFQKILLLCLFLLFTTQIITAQSKFEYGVGLGINHSEIKEEISTPAGPARSQSKGIRLPALYLKVAYNQSKRIHFNSGLGISWLGSFQRDLSAREIATTIEIPALIEWNFADHFLLRSGPIYNYILDMTNDDTVQNIDLLPSVNTRHHLGLQLGGAFSYEILELSLSYAHYITNVFNLRYTDENGNDIGTLVSRFRNFRIGITIRV